MASTPWWKTFEVEKNTSESTISEIARFIQLSLKNGKEYEEKAAKHLMTLLQSANIHFIVSESDIRGDSIRDEIEGIVEALESMKSIDPASTDLVKRIDFWIKQLMQLCLMITGRLVTYRQATDPSKKVTDNIKRFINGLRGFVVLHRPELSFYDDARWIDLLERINKDRDMVEVGKRSWERKLLRASATHLGQMDVNGLTIADDLKQHRLDRKADSAVKIIELNDKEILTLTTLRKKLEGVIDKSLSTGAETLLHRSPTHLFSAMSYYAAGPQVDAVLAASPDERNQVLLLLQKKFELLALQEVAVLLRTALNCYDKIVRVQDKSKNWQSKSVSMIEQVTELYWLQRRTLNVQHNAVDVDISEFIAYLKSLKDIQTTNADMWTPSLLKLEDTLQTGLLPMSSIQFVYDTLLLPKYTETSAAIGFFPSPKAIASAIATLMKTVGLKTPVVKPESLLVSFSPLVTKAPVLHRKPPPTTDDSSIKHSAIYAACVEHREIVRGLLRDILKAAAKVKGNATRVDVEMGRFSDLILLPFLSPILAQWHTCIDDYLKPMTPEHDDQQILAGAQNKVRDNALTRAAPKRLDNAAANLSSSSIFLIQVLKAFRLFMQIGAAFVAQKVFNESYVRKVFSEGRDPPPLRSMLFLMLSIDATAHLMLVLLLVLSSFAFKTDTNTFMVDDIFLTEVLTEFGISSLVLIVLGMMVADTMRRKRYFQYADQGQVVSAAYRSALLYICVVNFVVPFSVLIS